MNKRLSSGFVFIVFQMRKGGMLRLSNRKHVPDTDDDEFPFITFVPRISQSVISVYVESTVKEGCRGNLKPKPHSSVSLLYCTFLTYCSACSPVIGHVLGPFISFLLSVTSVVFKS